MASVLNRTTKQYLKSQDAQEFNITDWIVNPVLTLDVLATDPKFWIIEGDNVRLMTNVEKNITYLTAIKATKKAEIMVYAEALMLNGHVYNGHTYATDSIALLKIIGIGTYISLGHPLPPGFVWKTTDGVLTVFDSAGYSLFYASCTMWVAAIHGNIWLHESIIDTLSDYDLVDTYNYLAGWPA